MSEKIHYSKLILSRGKSRPNMVSVRYEGVQDTGNFGRCERGGLLYEIFHVDGGFVFMPPFGNGPLFVLPDEASVTEHLASFRCPIDYPKA